MPRAPIVLDPSQVVEVETLAALLNQDQIADYFGIGRTTFQSILGRDEEVAVRYKRGKARAIAHVANGLLQKARSGDTTSMIFYLKTQAGWRETDRPGESVGSHEEQEEEARRGSEKLQRFLDRIAERQRAAALSDSALERIAAGQPAEVDP